MTKSLISLIALVVLTHVAMAAESIQTVDDHNRVYKAACDIILPYMQLHDRADKKFTADTATELKSAIQMLDAVTAYAPENWNAFWVKGKAYQVLDDHKAARQAFKQAFDLQEKNPDVAREYMYECLNLGDSAEGLRAAQRAVATNSADAGLQANLALALLIAAKPKEALTAVDEALRMAPQDKITQTLRKMILEVIAGTRPQPKNLLELQK